MGAVLRGGGEGPLRWHSRVWPLVAEGFTAAGLSWRGGDKLPGTAAPKEGEFAPFQ